MKGIKTIEYNQADIKGRKIAIVATRWNSFIVDNLLAGALAHLTANGIEENNISIVYCPGAFEIPLVCKKIARRAEVDAIITLGAVIRGGTPHFEYVAGECTRGLTQVGLEFELPIAFGVLTVDNEQQARERSGYGEGSENKGEESAAVVLEMISLLSRI